MLFKTTQTKETEIDIPVPSYWREISTNATYIDFALLLFY